MSTPTRKSPSTHVRVDTVKPGQRVRTLIVRTYILDGIVTESNPHREGWSVVLDDGYELLVGDGGQLIEVVNTVARDDTQALPPHAAGRTIAKVMARKVVAGDLLLPGFEEVTDVSKEKLNGHTVYTFTLGDGDQTRTFKSAAELTVAR